MPISLHLNACNNTLSYAPLHADYTEIPLAFTKIPKISYSLVSQVQSITRVLWFTLTILLMPILLSSNASASSASLSLPRADSSLWAKPPSANPSFDGIPYANMEAVHGRIMDADITAESTCFARSNILVKSSASMNGQVNQLSSMALTLIQ